jgi:hypothetical protein
MVEIAPIDSTHAPEFPSPLPKGSPQQELFELREAVKKVNDRKTRLNMKPLKGLHQELDRLTLEEMDAVKKLVETEKTHNAWGYNRLLFSLGTSATSIIGGIYLVANGDEEGRKFIAAGSVTLANTLMEHLGGWTALAKLVSFGNSTAEFAVGLLPYAVSILTMTYTVYNMFSVPVAQHEWMAWISSTLSYIDATLRIGTIYTTVKKGLADIRLIDIRAQTTIATKKVEPITRRNDALGETSNTFASQTKRTMQAFNKVNSAAMAA